MRFFGSRRFARSAALVVAAFLLCLGAFLSRPAVPESQVYSAFTMMASPHADQGANGYGHAIDGNYLAAFAEEAEAGDKLPVNSALLTTLVLVVFFGTALGWLLAFGWASCRPEVSSLLGRYFPYIGRRHQRRPVAALLGVFRL